MKKCGNCNFNYDSKEKKCCCAYDNQYRSCDTIGCPKWSEYSYSLSPQARRDIASSNTQDDLSRDAISVAREANLIARSEAASAARSARWAKYAAIIAAVAAIVGPIITAWLTKK